MIWNKQLFSFGRHFRFHTSQCLSYEYECLSHPKEIWMPSQYIFLGAHYRRGRCIWKWYAMHSKHLGKISRQISGCRWSVCLASPLSDLKTALVERDDFSSGTSSRSTKLIHGGVRYLQKAIMKLDYEQVNASFFLHGWHLSVEFLVRLVILFYFPLTVHFSFSVALDMYP